MLDVAPVPAQVSAPLPVLLLPVSSGSLLAVIAKVRVDKRDPGRSSRGPNASGGSENGL